jgi:hypothetical protein
MFSRIASQSVVKRLVSFQSASNGVKQVSRSSFAAFSTAEIVPGIGLGKTSTGIVSSYTLCNCLIISAPYRKKHRAAQYCFFARNTRRFTVSYSALFLIIY